MAVFNEILAGRFNRALQKLFQIKGPPSTPQLASEIIPTIRMDDLMALEHRILLGVRSFSRSRTVASAAAQFAAWRLRNPAGSNVVATIEKITFASVLADQPVITRGPAPGTDLATGDAGNNSIRDFRMGAINSALVQSSQSGAGAQSGVQICQLALAANTSGDMILLPSQEIVVAPGDFVTIFSNVANQSINFTIYWRERALEESETLLGV